MNDSNLIKFNTDFQIVSSGKQIASNCCDIIFFNLGSNEVIVELMPLMQSQSFTIQGNIGELNVSNYNINFIDTGGTNSLLIIRKYYL